MALRVRVCRIAEVVCDELRAFKVRGVTWPVIVTYLDDDLVATQGVCPHEDIALVDGYLHEGTLICPAHAYTYDLRTGRCKHDASLELRRYPITIVADEIWIDLL